MSTAICERFHASPIFPLASAQVSGVVAWARSLIVPVSSTRESSTSFMLKSQSDVSVVMAARFAFSARICSSSLASIRSTPFEKWTRWS